MAATPAPVACCLCGTKLPANRMIEGMCASCLNAQVDVTEGIERHLELEMCRTCEQKGIFRWHRNPQWVVLQPETAELLALCVKKIRGLKGVHVVDAAWVWTEPHSRRLKVKLTVQKEVLSGTTLRQSLLVEYVVKTRNCDRCNKEAAKDTWQAKVQLRQRAEHPKTLFALEQTIRQHKMARGVVKIERAKDGLDFSFSRRQDAQAFVGCIGSIAPAKVKPSTSVVATNARTGTSNVRHVWAVEVAPICRNDLVCLPRALSSAQGHVGPLALVSRVGHSIHLVDPTSGGTAEVSGEVYWRQPFAPLASRQHLSTFVVFDAELDEAPWQHAQSGGAGGKASRGEARRAGGKGVTGGEAGSLAAILEVRSAEETRQAEEGKEGMEEDAGMVEARGEKAQEGTTEGGVEGQVGLGVGDELRDEREGAHSSAGNLASFMAGEVTWKGNGYSVSRCSSSSRRGSSVRPWLMGDVTVARATDLGKNDQTACVRSHLCELLHAGDEVEGYDLEAMSHLMSDVHTAMKDELPALLLVQRKEQRPSRMKKARSHRRRRHDGRRDSESCTTNTTYQDLDDLVDDDDDDEPMGADELAKLIGFMEKLGSASPKDGSENNFSGEERASSERPSGERVSRESDTVELA